MKIQSVKGTRDFYPEQLAFRNFLWEKIRGVSQLFGYQEYDAPIIEPFELYAAKSGDELVNQQSFVMEDRGGRKIVLRPELTPSLARMVAEKQNTLLRIIRWFSFGPMWRYEQPQRGRSREFWQWNIDLLGVNSPQADAELVEIAIQFLQSLGLDENDFVIKINDRKWFETQLTQIGIDKSLYIPLLRAIDRIDKMSENDWKAYVLDLGVKEEQFAKLYEFLKFASPDLITNDSTSLKQVFDTLNKKGLQNYITLDCTVVRGLDYYTGTVFEIRDKKGVLRAIGGGGRYENLVEQVGGQPLTGIGFALGDIPIQELLIEARKLPKEIIITPTIFVSVFSKDTLEKSYEIASLLRKAGIATEIFISDNDTNVDLEKQLKYADQKQIPYVIILGPQEIEKNIVTLKNLKTREQKQISIQEIIDEFQMS